MRVYVCMCEWHISQGLFPVMVYIIVIIDSSNKFSSFCFFFADRVDKAILLFLLVSCFSLGRMAERERERDDQVMMPPSHLDQAFKMNGVILTMGQIWCSL